MNKKMRAGLYKLKKKTAVACEKNRMFFSKIENVKF